MHFGSIIKGIKPIIMHDSNIKKWYVSSTLVRTWDKNKFQFNFLLEISFQLHLFNFFANHTRYSEFFILFNFFSEFCNPSVFSHSFSFSITHFRNQHIKNQYQHFFGTLKNRWHIILFYSPKIINLR